MNEKNSELVNSLTDESNNKIPQVQPMMQEVPQVQPMMQEVPQVQPMMQEVPQVQPMMQEVPQVQPMMQEVPQVQPMMQEVPQVQPMMQEVPQVQPMMQEVPQVQPMMQEVPQVQLMMQEVPQVEPMTQETAQIQPIINSQRNFNSEPNIIAPYPQPIIQATQKTLEEGVNLEMPNSIVNNYVNKNSKKENNKILKNKKILIIAGIVLIFIIVVIFLTVFNKKELTCSIKSSSLGMNLEAKLKVYFKQNNVSNVKYDMVFDLGEYKEYKDEMIKKLTEEYSSENVNADITSDESKIYIKIDATSKYFESLGLDDLSNYEESKSTLEKEGFVCK